MSPQKPKSRRRVLLRLLVVLAVLLWFSGAIGMALRPLLLSQLYRLEPRVTITQHGRTRAGLPAVGATLTVSRKRLYRLAREMFGLKGWLLPPGLIPEHYNFSGFTNFSLDEEQEEVALPVAIQIRAATQAPRLKVCLPADLVNEVLDFEGSFANRSKRRKYMLGHYETILWIRFDTLKLSSELSQQELRRAITFRRISGEATGQVKFRVKENIGSVSTTARIRKMELRCDLDFKQYADGTAIGYQITIPTLDADIKKLAPLFESRPTEALRKRLEKALSRPSKLERISRRRFPPGLPLDLALEVEVIAGGMPLERDASVAVSH